MAEIEVVPGGPMLVRGAPLHRLRHTGDVWSLEPVVTGPAYAVCRCGRSASMPFCDREPPYGCFEEIAASGPDPGPFRWDVPDPAEGPALALKPDGPVRVAGEVRITHGEVVVPPVAKISLCRCGASRCQPVCDSSHKVVGYRG